MAAGTQYNKHLNYDQAYVKTPAIYDSNLGEWLMLAGNYVKTAGGLWVPQKGSDDGEALVQLTGRNVEKITVFNALAITEVVEYASDPLDISAYKRIIALVRNTHDVEVYLRAFDVNLISPSAVLMDASGTQYKVTIPANLGGIVILFESDWPILGLVFPGSIKITVGSTGRVPTTGSFTMVLAGVRN